MRQFLRYGFWKTTPSEFERRLPEESLAIRPEVDIWRGGSIGNHGGALKKDRIS